MHSKLAVFVLVLAVAHAFGQGLPVKDKLVIERCGTCHSVDAQQRMSRISYMRKTPEGWEESILRMVRIHGISLTQPEARQIVQYLGDHHGLTASELAAFDYAIEHQQMAEPIPNETIKWACTTCHTYAKSALQRRTKDEWLKVKDFMMALTPTLVYQHRAEDWLTMADQSLAYFGEHFPLETPEWQREKDQPPPGAGQWVVVGHQPGKGDYAGMMAFRSAGGQDRESEANLEFVDGSKGVVRCKGRWFGGAAWRGNATAPDEKKMREVFHLLPDGNTLSGRSYLADHYELGNEETRYSASGNPKVVAVLPKAVRRGTSATLRIYGVGLATAMKLSDLSFGDGVSVEKIDEATANHVTVQVSVAPGAKVGKRDVRAGAASGSALLTVYDKVDYIRVLPDRTSARLGGIRYPKRFTQFEAHAFSKGADGTENTADDLDLGSVKAAWRVSEMYNTSPGEDDVPHVGTIDQNGLFTPGEEGPNPARRRTTNNAGDVWVEATHTPEGSTSALKSRAYLLVTLPAYRENLIP